MANIVFTIPPLLNAVGGYKKTESSADSLQNAFTKISEIFGYDFKRRVLEADNTPRCLLYTSPSPRDGLLSRMPSSA